jgi:hypothetical protein
MSSIPLDLLSRQALVAVLRPPFALSAAPTTRGRCFRRVRSGSGDLGGDIRLNVLCRVTPAATQTPRTDIAARR